MTRTVTVGVGQETEQGAEETAATADAEERERPISACREWPEHRERAEALEAYREAVRAVATMARAWVEGVAGGGP